MTPSPRRRRQPLPIRDGLNPSRAMLPLDAEPTTAHDFLTHLITTQRYRAAHDDAAEIAARFTRGEVVDQLGRPYAPGDLVTPGAALWFYRIPIPEAPVPFTITTLHEDEHILVVDKPPFLATFPRASHITETVLVRLRRATGNNDLSPAHRLDRMTSGVLVLTKHPAARGPYQELFARREVHKEYEAIAAYRDLAGARWEHRMDKVHGQPAAFITPGEPNAITTVASVTPLADAALASLTHRYGDLPPQARYRLIPLTGKTHQLRLHMSLAGVPITGDPVYPTLRPKGAVDDWGYGDAPENYQRPLLLQSKVLSFRDPLSGQERCFTSQLDLTALEASTPR